MNFFDLQSIFIILTLASIAVGIWLFPKIRDRYILMAVGRFRAKIASQITSAFTVVAPPVLPGLQQQLSQLAKLSSYADKARTEATTHFEEIKISEPADNASAEEMLELIKEFFDKPVFQQGDEAFDLFDVLLLLAEGAGLVSTIEAAYEKFATERAAGAFGKIIVPSDAADDLKRLWSAIKDAIFGTADGGEVESLPEIFSELVAKTKEHGGGLLKIAGASTDDILVASTDDILARVGSASSSAFDDVARQATDDIASSMFDDLLSSATFPYITVVLSSGREIKLLLKDDTDMDDAFRAIVHDVVGVGGGSAVGGTIGSFLGSVVPFFGTAVGAFVGGAIGGMLGKHITDHSKYAPLTEAREAYEREAAKAGEAIYRAVYDLTRELATASSTMQLETQFYLDDCPRVDRKNLFLSATNLRNQLIEDVRDAELQVKSKQSEARVSLPRPPWYISIIGFSPIQEMERVIERHVSSALATLRKVELALPGEQVIASDPIKALNALAMQPSVMPYGTARQKIVERDRGFSAQIKEINVSYLISFLIWARAISNLYTSCATRLAAALHEELPAYTSTAEKQRSHVRKFSDALEAQMRKFNIEVKN